MREILPTPKKFGVVFLLFVIGAMFTFKVEAAASRCVTIDSPSLLLECYRNLTKEREARTNNVEQNRSPFVLIDSNLNSGWQLVAVGLSGDQWRSINLRVYSKHFWIRSDEKRDIERVSDLRPSLWFRCIDGKMSGFLDWGIFLDVEKARIVFRLDSDPPKALIAPVSKDHKKIEPISENWVILRIKQMFGKKTLTARVTPQGQKTLAVVFNISGIENAVKPLRKSCYW